MVSYGQRQQTATREAARTQAKRFQFERWTRYLTKKIALQIGSLINVLPENMKVDPEIVGYWAGESSAVKGELEYLAIDGEGRLIQEILDPYNPGRTAPLRLWCRREEGAPTNYQTSVAPTFATSWHVRMKVMTARLLIERTEGLTFEFTRVAEVLIPPRIKERISQSRESMKQKEGEIPCHP